MSTNKHNIVVVDDEEDVLSSLNSLLKKFYQVYTFSDPRKALNFISSKDIDVVLLDIRMPVIDGITLLQKIKDVTPLTEVIMITALTDIKTAVTAMKKGAYDYINKPFDVDELKASIEKALEKRILSKENFAYRMEASNAYCDMIGKSKPMRLLFQTIENIAKTDSTVLIIGETGTGKELIARAIHKKSLRAQKPFVAINCAAIPDNLFETELFGYEKGAFTGAFERKIGKFEYSSEGTIFLDEIGCLSLSLQAKLLRVLQENEITRIGGNEPISINCRLICATNLELSELVKKGNFREDLFYRLNVIPIKVPPLREREDDAVIIFKSFVEKFNRKFNRDVKITDKVIKAIRNYKWPGNVRELENVAERFVALAKEDVVLVEEFNLTDENKVEVELPLNDFVEKQESDYILKALQKCSWNQTKTAELLKVDRSTLISKMKKYSLKE